MAIIKPFRAVRPAKNYVDMVAELPYDVMNREEAKKMGEENKYSFIHIDRAEVDLDDNVDEHDEAVYLKAKENLDKFKDEKITFIEKSWMAEHKQVLSHVYLLTTISMVL